MEALALGGSRASQHFDQDSDYDVYVYLSAPLAPATRQEILSKYCSYMEIGNQFWELGDDFDQDLWTVVLEHQAQNSYTTCIVVQSGPQQDSLRSRRSLCCPPEQVQPALSS